MVFERNIASPMMPGIMLGREAVVGAEDPGVGVAGTAADAAVVLDAPVWHGVSGVADVR